MIEIPSPNPQILSCQSEILPGLPALAEPEALVSSEEKRRAFETDGLTACRPTPLVVVLPARIKEISCSRLMHRKWCRGRRRGDLAGRFRRHWRLAVERCLVRRLYQPDRTQSSGPDVVKYVDRCPLCISRMTTCSFPRTGRRYLRYGSRTGWSIIHADHARLCRVRMLRGFSLAPDFSVP